MIQTQIFLLLFPSEIPTDSTLTQMRSTISFTLSKHTRFFSQKSNSVLKLHLIQSSYTNFRIANGCLLKLRSSTCKDFLFHKSNNPILYHFCGIVYRYDSILIGKNANFSQGSRTSILTICYGHRREWGRNEAMLSCRYLNGCAHQAFLDIFRSFSSIRSK